MTTERGPGECVTTGGHTYARSEQWRICIECGQQRPVAVMVDRLATLEAQRQAVLDLHRPVEVRRGGPTICDACNIEAWPCATVTALGGDQ